MSENDKLGSLFKLLVANDENLDSVDSEQECELILEKHFEIAKEIKKNGGDLIDDIELKTRLF